MIYLREGTLCAGTVEKLIEILVTVGQRGIPGKLAICNSIFVVACGSRSLPCVRTFSSRLLHVCIVKRSWVIHSLGSKRDGNLPRRNGKLGLIDSGNSSRMVGADVRDIASQVGTACTDQEGQITQELAIRPT